MPAAAHSTTPLNTDWRERYQLVGKIGSGGFADVYEAQDLTLDRRVALKVVPEGRGMSARVLREVQAAAALSHPNIVTLYDWFGDGERSFIVWELVEGESLDHLSQSLGDADVVAVGAELLEGLAFAHSQGIVHRDVKPQNVMLDAEGHVKVMDFGIALLLNTDTLTKEGDVVGTVAYMSPEQAAGRRVGPPSDVYSAGMVLFELLASEHPLRGDTPAETLANVAAARLPSLAVLRPDLPDDLCSLIDDACAPRPADRPAAADLATALRGLFESSALSAHRWQRMQGRAWPLMRVGPAVERLGGAGLATVAAAVVLQSLPAYPQAWIVPLLALCAAFWAIVPRAGLAWLLGVLAFPFFNVSLSAGSAYLLFAVAAFLIGRTRPVVVVWPACGLLLAPLYLTLLAPAGAVLLGRVRGPLTAVWAGAVTFLYLVLVRDPGPFTVFQSQPTLARDLAAAGDPLAVVSGLLQVLLTPAGLLQMGVWGGLAAVLGLAFATRGLELRLWLWALCFAGVCLAYTVVPGVVWDVPVTLMPLLLDVAAAATVIILPLALWADGLPEELDGEHLQGD
ncbi:MAG TPA: serine/threonine-protein kinase [Thermoleophilia bacterium]|nr:serine/threonine-protein kinase [Thermoleophilia bacterium]